MSDDFFDAVRMPRPMGLIVEGHDVVFPLWMRMTLEDAFPGKAVEVYASTATSEQLPEPIGFTISRMPGVVCPLWLLAHMKDAFPDEEVEMVYSEQSETA